MVCPWAAYEGDSLQIWRVAANILICSHRYLTKGGLPDWGLGNRLTTPRHKKPASYKMLHRSSDLDGSCVTTKALKSGYNIWYMEY
jgi:hypothetical protein